MNSQENRILSTQKMVRISILAVIGAILTILNMDVPGFPTFLSIDLGNIPAVIGAITMGPLPAVFIELIRNLIKFILDSSTGGIGEFANFMMGIGYIIPFAIIYNKMPNKKGFLIGAIIGTIIMTIMGAILNYFVLIPLFSVLMGGLDLIISMASMANSSITDLRTLILLAIIPFNIFKGIVITVVGYLLYRSLKPALHKMSLDKK